MQSFDKVSNRTAIKTPFTRIDRQVKLPLWNVVLTQQMTLDLVQKALNIFQFLCPDWLCFSVFEAVCIVTGFQNMTVVSDTIQQGRCHFGTTK
ncbi:hypothetical protein ACFQ35_09895 [Pseudochrobactrum kiredjianiae]|uniref:Uncharacterized protein n=1 Tax=Pseudochrobactrum kiredjianiae TaxID=386305 RepID=A0ABW3V606_9HYPH